MKSTILVLALTLFVITVESNHEGDVLYQWRTMLLDPNNVLSSWDPTLVNPCTWFHVTCNSENSITRVDLGNAALSGPLLPQLGSLTNLQYLYVYGNKISGSIPTELGNLTNLISLGLSDNLLSGSIPPSLGNLRSLKFLTLNGNNLTGSIPSTLIQLALWGDLRTLNVSNNDLIGTRRTTGFRRTTIIQDPKV